MKLPAAVVDMINVVVEIARMSVCVQQMNRVLTVACVFDVRAVAKCNGYIDNNMTAVPSCPQIVRPCISRLEARIEPPIKIV